MQQKINELETSEMAVHNWRKRVTEEECKLERKEELLDSVISERNHYSKNLVDAQVSTELTLIHLIQCQVLSLSFFLLLFNLKDGSTPPRTALQS